MTDRRPATDAPPRWLQGAWRRHGRHLGRREGPEVEVAAATDAGDADEISDVLWIQVGSYFADVRVARTDSAVASDLDRTQAFSGSVTYHHPVIIWRHDLDTVGRPVGYEDRAEVEPQGPDRFFERAPGYLEVWQREGDSDVATAVLDKHNGHSAVPTARVVRAGDLVACVWTGPEPGGAALRHEDGGWDLIAVVGPESIPWAAVSAAQTGRALTGWHRIA